MGDGEPNKINKEFIILVYILIILVAGSFLVSLWRLNEMDRKLTCIYSLIDALPFYMASESLDELGVFQKQVKFIESSCDRGYGMFFQVFREKIFSSLLR